MSETKIITAFVLLLASTMALIFAGMASKTSDGADAHIKWDMPMAYADSNYQTQNAKQFAEQVMECSGGEFEIVIHGSGSLLKGAEIKRAVQTGQVPMGERLLSAHANENALFAVDSIPFIAPGFEASTRLWRIAEPTLAELLYEENLILLYSVPWPPSGLYFKHTVNNLDDVKGSKFRAYNAATARVAELAGMVPVQIEADELNQALAMGVVETLMASGSTGYDRKVWEQLTHYYDIKAWSPRNYVFTNKDDFNRLSSRNQECLVDASELAETRGTERAKELTRWYLERLVENGIEINTAAPELMVELSEIGKAMTQEWLQSAGPRGAAVLEAFNAE